MTVAVPSASTASATSRALRRGLPACPAVLIAIAMLIPADGFHVEHIAADAGRHFLCLAMALACVALAWLLLGQPFALVAARALAQSSGDADAVARAREDADRFLCGVTLASFFCCFWLVWMGAAPAPSRPHLVVMGAAFVSLMVLSVFSMIPVFGHPLLSGSIENAADPGACAAVDREQAYLAYAVILVIQIALASTAFLRS